MQDQTHTDRFHRGETQPTANYMGIFMCPQGGETPKSSGTFLFFPPEKSPLRLYEGINDVFLITFSHA